MGKLQSRTAQTFELHESLPDIGPNPGCQNLYRHATQTRIEEAGTDLLLEFDECGSVFIVLNGWLALSKSLENGQKQIIDFALPGEVINPTSADGITSTVTIEALTPASVSIIPVTSWNAMLRESDELSSFLHCLNAANHARQAERIIRLGKGSAEMRVAYALIEFCVRLGSLCEGLDSVIRIPLTQQQLGDSVGLSSVHVCRTLRRLTRSGVLEIRNPMEIRILQTELLEILAGVDQDLLKREIMPSSCLPLELSETCSTVSRDNIDQVTGKKANPLRTRTTAKEGAIVDDDCPAPPAGRIQRTLSQTLPTDRSNGRRCISEKLGDDPSGMLHAMREYGLTDREVARYYGITPSSVRRLEHYFGINGI